MVLKELVSMTHSPPTIHQPGTYISGLHLHPSVKKTPDVFETSEGNKFVLVFK